MASGLPPLAHRARSHRADRPARPPEHPQERTAVKSAVETLNPTRVKLTVEHNTQLSQVPTEPPGERVFVLEDQCLVAGVEVDPVELVGVGPIADMNRIARSISSASFS